MAIISVGLCVLDSVEAVRLYCDAFGLTLGYHVRNADGTFYHSELMRGQVEMLSVVERREDAAMGYNPVQLAFRFTQEDDLQRAFALLREGGTTLMDICTLPWSPCCAEVIDRFGVRWYLTTPMHRPPDTFTPPEDA